MKLEFYWKHYFLYKKCMKEIEKNAMEQILARRRTKCREFDSIYDYYKYYFLGVY